MNGRKLFDVTMPTFRFLGTFHLHFFEVQASYVSSAFSFTLQNSSKENNVAVHAFL